MDDEAQYLGSIGGLGNSAAQGALQAQRQYAMNQLIHPPQDAAQMKAEQDAQEARWAAERAQERDERTRKVALQLAAAVTGTHGDASLTVSAATDFLAFLNGAEKRPH